MATALRIVDSITELSANDAHCIAVSGSHGGISSARYALAARPLLSVFNDAGVGLGAAGIAALDFLQQHDLAACTVAHTSACIGQAHSSYEQGVVSHANPLAVALGLRAGLPLHGQVHTLLRALQK
jgi:NCAIR mutase (PurE)-related protein